MRLSFLKKQRFPRDLPCMVVSVTLPCVWAIYTSSLSEGRIVNNTQLPICATLLTKCLNGSNQNSRGQISEMKNESCPGSQHCSLFYFRKYTPCPHTQYRFLGLWHFAKVHKPMDRPVLHSKKSFLHPGVAEVVRAK